MSNGPAVNAYVVPLHTFPDLYHLINISSKTYRKSIHQPTGNGTTGLSSVTDAFRWVETWRSCHCHTHLMATLLPSITMGFNVLSGSFSPSWVSAGLHPRETSMGPVVKGKGEASLSTEDPALARTSSPSTALLSAPSPSFSSTLRASLAE